MSLQVAEPMALLCAQELISAARPFIFLEWFEQNFKHYGCKAEDLIAVADDLQYDLFYLTPIVSGQILKMHLSQTAYFVVIPRMLVHSLNAVSLISPPQPSLFEGSNTRQADFLSGIPVSLEQDVDPRNANEPAARFAEFIGNLALAFNPAAIAIRCGTTRGVRSNADAAHR